MPSFPIRGKASWYSDGANAWSGWPRVDNAADMTCAAVGSIPFGTRLRVTNLRNGKSVVVTVADRGNFARLGRLLDMRPRPAALLGMKTAGVVPVLVDKEK